MTNDKWKSRKRIFLFWLHTETENTFKSFLPCSTAVDRCSRKRWSTIIAFRSLFKHRFFVSFSFHSFVWLSSVGFHLIWLFFLETIRHIIATATQANYFYHKLCFQNQIERDVREIKTNSFSSSAFSLFAFFL